MNNDVIQRGWEVARFDQSTQAITLPCPPPTTTLTLADVYEGIDFSQTVTGDCSSEYMPSG